MFRGVAGFVATCGAIVAWCLMSGLISDALFNSRVTSTPFQVCFKLARGGWLVLAMAVYGLRGRFPSYATGVLWGLIATFLALSAWWFLLYRLPNLLA